MKIAYISPGILPAPELNRREELLRSWASKGTEVELCCVSTGPRSIESAYEEYLSVIPACQKVVELEKRGFDAAILGCACDPGLDALREVSQKMLVLGAGSISYMAAAMLGARFAVLTVDLGLVRACYDLAHQVGCERKLVAVEAIEVPVLDLGHDRDGTLRTLTAAGKRLIEESQVDTLVLGCMSMGFLGISAELALRTGVPCIDPSRIAIKMAEALSSNGLSHSKAAYPLPAKLRKDPQLTLEDLCTDRREI